MTDDRRVHLCITYHMENATEEAETCITLPMSAFVAADILRHGEESIALSRKGRVVSILTDLAALQGYRYTGAVSYEQDKKWLERGEEVIE